VKRVSVVFTVILSLFCTEVALGFTMTSPFGWRNHPVTEKSNFHRGVDIKARRGTPIMALFIGEVIWANWRRGYGKTVLLYMGCKPQFSGVMMKNVTKIWGWNAKRCYIFFYPFKSAILANAAF
jgi:hypothetical protein